MISVAYPYYTSYPMGIYQAGQNQYQTLPMNQPPVPVPAQPTQPVNQPGSGIIWCQGEEGAKGYLVAPGNSVLLMDSENATFYIKSTDASGMPQPLRIFDYTERTAQRTPSQSTSAPMEEYVTRKEFDALAARLETLASMKEPGRETVRETTRPAVKKTALKEDLNHE